MKSLLILLVCFAVFAGACAVPTAPTPVPATTVSTVPASQTARPDPTALPTASAPANPTPQAYPLAPALIWHRTGAGLCQEVHLLAAGTFVGYACQADPIVEVGRGELSAASVAQIQGWVYSLGSFDVEQPDPAEAGLTVRLRFSGSGTGAAGQADRLAMHALAADLWRAVAPPSATPTPDVFPPMPPEGRAQDAARTALAQQLGVDVTTIKVRKIVPTDWPDSCLGLTRPGQACQIVVTPGFRIVLDVNGAAYEVRTNLLATTVMVAGRVDATTGSLPAVCQGIGLATYYAPENSFCFAYPARFHLGETNPTRGELFGPPLDQSADALRASLLLEVRPLTAGEGLNTVVGAYLAQFAGMGVPPIERSPMSLGGEPAEHLQVVPGREGSQDVFMVHQRTLFHLMFMPSVRDFPQARQAVEDLYLTVTSSFAFLPAAPK